MKINTKSIISKYSTIRKFTTGNSLDDIKSENMEEYFKKNKYKLIFALGLSMFFAWKLTVILLFVIALGIGFNFLLPKNKK